MRAVAWLLLLPFVLPAGDREFDALVRNIELRYDVRRTHIPLFGLANFFVKATRPGGTSDLRMAIFENLLFPGGTPLPDSILGQDWHALVRVHSQRNSEWTGVYTRPSGRRIEMLIATFESNEATLLKLRIRPESLREWVDQPERKARHR